MWGFLELLHLAVVAAVPVQAYVAAVDTPLPALHQAVKLTLKRSDSCIHEGILFSYERDWEEEIPQADGQVTIRPKKLGEIDGYAILVNKRSCSDGSPITNYFVVGEHRQGLFNRGKVAEGVLVRGQDASQLRPDQRPKWLPQVMRFLDEQNGKDSVVTEFMASLPRAPSATTTEAFAIPATTTN